MYWPLLAAVALAVGYYQVGAMSVWVTVLSITPESRSVGSGGRSLGRRRHSPAPPLRPMI